jgi:hypothetical protein
MLKFITIDANGKPIYHDNRVKHHLLTKYVSAFKSDSSQINLPDDFMEFNKLIGLPRHPIHKNPIGLLPYQIEFHKKIQQIIGNLPIHIEFEQPTDPLIILRSTNMSTDSSVPSTIELPLKQFKSGVAAKDVKCNTGFQLILKGSDNSPACIKNTSIPDFFDRSWATKTMNVENSDLSIMYSMVGGIMTESKMDTQSNSLLVSINARTNGTLAITIPRALIHAVKYNGVDEKFYVLANGQEARFTETHTNTTDRTLLIPFQNDTSQIEIIGPSIM